MRGWKGEQLKGHGRGLGKGKGQIGGGGLFECLKKESSKY